MEGISANNKRKSPQALLLERNPKRFLSSLHLKSFTTDDLSMRQTYNSLCLDTPAFNFLGSESQPSTTSSSCSMSFTTPSTRSPSACDLNTCLDSAFNSPRSTSLVNSVTCSIFERPFSCPYCPMTFKRKYTMQEHVRIHLGHRPYSCINCGRAFTQSSSLWRHTKICLNRSE